VAAGLVIGIYAETDAKALEDALRGQQIDVSKVKVFATDGDDTKSSSLRFVSVVDSEPNPPLSLGMTEGTGVMQDFGTAVPGLSDRGEQPGPIYSFEEGDGSKHYLADYPVPDDEVENFDDAITDGRAVVLYPDAGADAQKIAAAFEAAGLRNVRSY
jgi:hypothetical protein